VSARPTQPQPEAARTRGQRRIVRVPDESAVNAAARVRRELGLRDLADLDVVLIGAHYGLVPVVRDLENEEAHLLRMGRRGLVCIDRRVWETGTWRFPFAHELGHWLLHEAHDDLSRVTAAKKTSARRATESSASDFAGVLLVPDDLVTARWDLRAPDLATVAAIGAACAVSVSVAALRVLQMTEAPRAIAYSVGGRVAWWAETSAFGARVRAGRAVPKGSEAARLHDAAIEGLGESWGREVAGSAVKVEGDAVVSWLG